MVIANRIRHNIHDEDPVFIVNPDNVLSLPIMPVKETVARSFGEFSLWYNRFRPISDEAVLNLKRTFATMFHMTTPHLFALNHYDQKFGLYGAYFIAILNRVFDIHNKTPAIDILFWDTKEKPYPYSKLKFPDQILLTNDAEEQLARKILNYFAKCTVTTMPPPKGNAAYQYLVENKIECHFTRAVIYPLYPNVDDRTIDQSPRSLHHVFFHTDHKKPVCKLGLADLRLVKFKEYMDEDNCSTCKRYSEDLKKCSRCHLVQYCNRTCQKEHWKVHKPYCDHLPNSN